MSNPFENIESVITFMQSFDVDSIKEKIEDGSIKEYEKEMRLYADLLEENAAILQHSLRYIGRG